MSGSGLRILIAMGVVGVVAIGCGGSGGSDSSLYNTSLKRVDALDLAMSLYTNDWDDGLPLPNAWMDGMLPYQKNTADYNSPAVKGGYGYALNSAVAGQSFSSFSDPYTTIAFFDSTDIRRNATDPTSTMPTPPRYDGKNTIGYLASQPVTQPPPTGYALSQQNVKQLSLGLLEYANDYDEVTPLPNTWMDALTPYVKNPADFQSPAVVKKNPSDYGYAMNSDIAAQVTTNFANPATEIALFDSTVLIRNATEPTSTLPNPPRYGSNNTIGYLDGHVH